MKEIPLTQGKFALVDDDDYEWLTQWKWHYTSSYSLLGYAVNYKGGRPNFMHRVIAKTPNGMDTDHINGDTLDNRKCNLRICTREENNRNKRLYSNSTSGFKGVYWNGGKWFARVSYKGRKIYVGRFDDLIEAALAYDEAAKKYYGEFARTNF